VDFAVESHPRVNDESNVPPVKHFKELTFAMYPMLHCVMHELPDEMFVPQEAS